LVRTVKMVARETADAKNASPNTLRRKRKNVLKVSSRKVFLGIRCIVPGRTVPTQGICVEEKEILGNVLNAWAAGLLHGRGLPAEAKVTGSSENQELSLKFPLDLIRKSLPVKNGRQTVCVWLPASAFEVPAETPEPKTKAKSEAVTTKQPSKEKRVAKAKPEASKEPKEKEASKEPKEKEVRKETEKTHEGKEAIGGNRSQETKPGQTDDASDDDGAGFWDKFMED